MEERIPSATLFGPGFIWTSSLLSCGRTFDRSFALGAKLYRGLAALGYFDPCDGKGARHGCGSEFGPCGRAESVPANHIAVFRENPALAGCIFCSGRDLDDLSAHYRRVGLEPEPLVSGIDFRGSLGALDVCQFERFDWRDDCAIGTPIDGNRFAGRPSTVVAIDFRGFGACAWRGRVLGDSGDRSRSESIWAVDHSGDVDVPHLLAGSHGAVPSVSWGFVLRQKSRLAPGKMGRGFQLYAGGDAASDSLDTFDWRPYSLASSGGKNLPCHVGAKLFLFSLAVFPTRDSTRGAAGNSACGEDPATTSICLRLLIPTTSQSPGDNHERGVKTMTPGPPAGRGTE